MSAPAAAPAVTIRPARVDELESLREIELDACLALIEAGVPLDGPSALPREALETSLAEDFLFVATDEADRPVGFLAGRTLDDALYILEVDVLRGWQQRGIGRALMRHAIGAARTRGLACVMLTTERDVRFNAPFYASLGFIEPDATDMPPALTAILADEASHGLDPARRVAMLLGFG